jgi:hypothetical protein
MAKVVLPGRQVIPTGGAERVEVPSGFGQAKFQAEGRLGAALQSLGGQFAQLGQQVQAAQDRKDLSQSQIDYNAAMNAHLIEQEKNPNFNEWAGNTTVRHDEIVGEITGRKMSKRAKEVFNLWAQSQENRVHFSVATRSNKLIAEDERNSLQLLMESTARAGQEETFHNKLDAMVEGNNLLPSEREEWKAKFEFETINNQVGLFIEAGDFENAQKAIDLVEDVDTRTALNARLKGAEAAQKRARDAQLRELRERTYGTLMADYWDGVLTNPQIVTDALREGLITTEAAKGLRKAMTETSSRTGSDLAAVKDVEESLLKLRQGLIDKEEAYSTLMARSGLLTNTDGRSYIQEIAKTEEDVSSTWDRRAFDYIETQILNVSSLTGIKFGSAEQEALSAQAIIKYSEAKRQAAAEGKPLQGEELLALAHKVMLPFRQQIKPLLTPQPGEGVFHRFSQLSIVRRLDYSLAEEIELLVQRQTLQRLSIAFRTKMPVKLIMTDMQRGSNNAYTPI